MAIIKVVDLHLCFASIWSVMDGVIGRLPWCSSVTLPVVWNGRWLFGQDRGGVSASVEVSILHVVV
jgi:hypothetical protein